MPVTTVHGGKAALAFAPEKDAAQVKGDRIARAAESMTAEAGEDPSTVLSKLYAFRPEDGEINLSSTRVQ